MKVILRWTNELRGTVEGELSGSWNKSQGVAHLDGLGEAKLELDGDKVRLHAKGHEEHGYIWQENEHEAVIHIPEA